jgi:serine/threonine protein kinase
MGVTRDVIGKEVTWYLVSTLYENGSLAAAFSGFRDMFVDSVETQAVKVHWIMQIASGLAFLHMKNKAHFDLKPDNIVLDASFNAKIIDTGFVAHFPDTLGIRTDRGSWMFASPEMIQNHFVCKGKKADSRFHDIHLSSDVYSFGLLALTIVEGHARGMYKELKKVRDDWKKTANTCATKDDEQFFTRLQTGYHCIKDAFGVGADGAGKDEGDICLVPNTDKLEKMGSLCRVLKPCLSYNPLNRPRMEMVARQLVRVLDDFSIGTKQSVSKTMMASGAVTDHVQTQPVTTSVNHDSDVIVMKSPPRIQRKPSIRFDDNSNSSSSISEDNEQ